MFEVLKAILLGIVEGITEWLPISSTGHMILVDEFIKLDVSPAFKEMFFVVIQLGAIFAVVLLFWNKLWPFHKVDTDCEEVYVIRRQDNGMIATWKRFVNWIFQFTSMEKFILWMKILVSCIPAMVIGLPFNDFIEKKFNNYVVVAITLIVYGVLFIVIENGNKNRKPNIKRVDDITWKIALFIGIFQVLSLIPGTSRSGATIIGGILVGCSRKAASEYTFFLAIPVMFGASLLKILKHGLAFSGMEYLILFTGMFVAFIVSILAIKFLMGYIKKHDFKVFGWYRIVLGILVLGYFVGKTLLA